MKAYQQYFPATLFVKLYKVVQTFESVYQINRCDHLNKRSRGTYSVKG